MQNALLVQTVAGMPADVEAKTDGKKLPNLKAEAVGNTLPENAIRSGGQDNCEHQPVWRTRHRLKRVTLMQVCTLTQFLTHSTKLNLRHWSIRSLTIFAQVQAKTVTDTLTGLHRR